MSDDYIVNYGIGYEVVESEHTPRDGLNEGPAEYINENLSASFGYFQAGDGTISNHATAVFIVVNEPFKGGLDLTKKKAELDTEIKRLKLDAASEFGGVGGLYVW